MQKLSRFISADRQGHNIKDVSTVAPRLLFSSHDQWRTVWPLGQRSSDYSHVNLMLIPSQWQLISDLNSFDHESSIWDLSGCLTNCDTRTGSCVAGYMESFRPVAHRDPRIYLNVWSEPFHLCPTWSVPLPSAASHYLVHQPTRKHSSLLSACTRRTSRWHLSAEWRGWN